MIEEAPWNPHLERFGSMISGALPAKWPQRALESHYEHLVYAGRELAF